MCEAIKRIPASVPLKEKGTNESYIYYGIRGTGDRATVHRVRGNELTADISAHGSSGDAAKRRLGRIRIRGSSG